jgi:hypothetical protein
MSLFNLLTGTENQDVWYSDVLQKLEEWWHEPINLTFRTVPQGRRGSLQQTVYYLDMCKL